MPDEISTDTLVRVRLWTVIPLLIGLLTGAAGAVGTAYRVRDGLIAAEAQQRAEVLKDYPTRQELWQDMNRMSQKRDSQYHDLRDRLGGVEGKVDGIVIYLRKKL